MGKSSSYLRAAGLISLATMLSRVLGLVREQVFAYFFGAGLVTDAFQIAFRIPNLLRDLFAEGSMSTALVPIYAKVRGEKGEVEAWNLVTRLISVLGVTLIAICTVAILGARGIVGIFPLEPGSEKFELTVRLTRLMIPFLPTVFLAAVWMSVLNARERFAIPALAPSMFNILSIFAAFTFAPLCEHLGFHSIYGMAIGVVVGGLAQWFCQVPQLRREGFRFRFRFQPADPQLLKIIGLMGFGAISMAATQVNVMVSSFLALSQGDGAVSWLNYAFRLMQFPLGVFGVAIAQVTLTKVALSSVKNDLGAIRETVVHSLRVAMTITIPSAVGLAAFGLPIIALIFEHGRFTPDDTRATALALACYALGLTGYSCTKVLIPVLYTLGKPVMAVVSSVGTVATNLILCLLLVKEMGFAGLALSTSIAAYLNLGVLLIFVGKHAGGLNWRSLIDGLLRCVFASALMGGVLTFFWFSIEANWPMWNLLVRSFIVLSGLLLGAGTYWMCARIIELREVRAIEAILLRRLGRG